MEVSQLKRRRSVKKVSTYQTGHRSPLDLPGMADMFLICMTCMIFMICVILLMLPGGSRLIRMIQHNVSRMGLYCCTDPAHLRTADSELQLVDRDFVNKSERGQVRIQISISIS